MNFSCVWNGYGDVWTDVYSVYSSEDVFVKSGSMRFIFCNNEFLGLEF